MNPFDTYRQPRNDAEEDLYQVLGLEADATSDQVRVAYRDLVRQYHPDAGLVNDTGLLFRRIQEAYETLRDPERRQRYDDTLRRAGQRTPQLLDLDVTLGPTQLPCLDEIQILYALIKITPVSTQPSLRTPLNLCLVLDRSTSMKGERLAAVKEATLSMVEQMEPEDLFSLVTFSDRAEVLVPAQQKPDRRSLRATLSTLAAGGGTEIFQGLSAGLAEVRRVCSDRQINHVLLLTDGHTYGDAENCLLAARTAAHQNIGISGIGVGNDWNEDFLDLLASAGGGTVLYIEDSSNIGAAFEHRLRDFKDAWIPELVLRLRYDPRAEHKGIFSISPELKTLRRDEGDVVIGPLQRTDARILLLEMLVGPEPEGLHRLLQMDVRGSVPAYGVVAARQRGLWVEFLPSGHTRPLIPPSILEAVQRVNLLRMQERAHAEAKQGLIGPATQRLTVLSSALFRQGEGDLARAIQKEAEQLAATGAFFGRRGEAAPLRHALLDFADGDRPMRLCPQCRAPYFPNAIFCESCGASLRTLQEDGGGAVTASLPGSGPLRAITLEVGAGGRRVELNLGSEALVLGRADQSMGLKPALDLTEDGGADAGVSRRHARLLLKGDQVLLEDLDSANGTWINDVRARPHQPFPLRHGDVIRMGRLIVRVRLVAKH